MKRKTAIALTCGLTAVVLSGFAAWEAAAARGGALTSLVGITIKEPLAAAALAHDPAFTFADDHLDGAYFYTIAVDPLALGVEHTLVDVGAYRYSHPGYGWLAWLLSAGRPSAVPLALLLIGLACMFVAAAAASQLAVELGWSPWAGLFVALNPGLVFATMAMNSEPLALAVLILTLLAWMRRRIAWAGVGLVALCLIKEQFVIVPLGLLVWDLVRDRREARAGLGAEPWGPRLAILAAGPIALALWILYLQSVFGEWSFLQRPLQEHPLTTPPFGYLDSIRRASVQHAATVHTSQVGGASLPLLIVVGAVLVIGIVRGFRLTSPIDPVFIGLTILVFSLTWVQLLYPKDLMRIAAVQLTLLPAVLAGARPPPAVTGDRRPPEVEGDRALMRT